MKFRNKKTLGDFNHFILYLKVKKMALHVLQGQIKHLLPNPPSKFQKVSKSVLMYCSNFFSKGGGSLVLKVRESLEFGLCGCASPSDNRINTINVFKNLKHLISL